MEMNHDQLIASYIESNPHRPGLEDVRLREFGVPVWALIGHLHGVRWDISRTARDYRVPVEAVNAAVAYYKKHKLLIEARIDANSTTVP